MNFLLSSNQQLSLGFSMYTGIVRWSNFNFAIGRHLKCHVVYLTFINLTDEIEICMRSVCPNKGYFQVDLRIHFNGSFFRLLS